MELRKINPVALSVIGGCFIFLATYILFWVLFLCLDSPNASREAIDILGSYFGGITTLWAAIVAAYLFDDWKEQADYETKKELSLDIIGLLAAIRFELIMTQEMLINLKLVESHLFLNTDYKNNHWNSFKKNINTTYPKIKYIKRNNLIYDFDISKDYADLERYYEHIGTNFQNIIKEYSKYYDGMISELNMDKDKNYSQPHDHYSKIGILKPSKANDFLNEINKECGFWIIYPKNQELIKFENINDMINSALTILSRMETGLLDICSPTPKEPSHISPHSHSS
jgi:hypothetical protein